MFGGPLLGVAVFLAIAVGIGWGLTKLFQSMLDQTVQTLETQTLDHGFNPDTVYLTQKEMLIGRRSYGDLVIAPGKEDLPPNAPSRHYWPTTQQYRASADPGKDYPDLVGLIERNTPVRFVEVIDDRDNAQTRVLVKVQVLDGPFAQAQPVLGMYLESADKDPESGEERYDPRADLFKRFKPEVRPDPTPVQSSD